MAKSEPGLIKEMIANVMNTIDGVDGLIFIIPFAMGKLGLSARQINIFCQNTPEGKKGEELWMEYICRRNAKEAVAGYDFCSFISEVLVEAGHPL